MSNTVAYMKTAFMLSPLYHPATATGRTVGRMVATARSAAPSKMLSTKATTGFVTKPVLHHQHHQDRQFSTSTRQQLKVKEFFPKPDNPNIAYAPPAWPHPVYSEEEMHNIDVQHREAKTRSDKVALGLMRLLRWGLDTATFYAPEEKAAVATSPKPGPVQASTTSSSSDLGKSAPPSSSPATALQEQQQQQQQQLPAKKKSWLRMNERKWLIRMVFLESVAGVPGMVGGMLRHLHSLRRMKRDNGWIETLLEEAYNERMHLLTFLKMAEPGLFMRLMILLTQGVFFNSFFISYLISPRTCHRFVGYLEEEAVYTYGRIIRDLEAGKLPAWSDPTFPIPDIAVDYWRIPEGKRTMRDLLYYIRADEAKHREVNHTLGNLDQNADPNPYTSVYVEKDTRPHPEKGLGNHHPKGWEREEVM